MATLAEYYLDELYKWKSLIDSHREEINRLQEKLKTLLHSDYVLLFTGTAEQHLKQLADSKQNILHVYYAIQSFERKLYKDQVLAVNKAVTDRIRRLHKQIRKDLQNALAEFSEVKNNCHQFIAYVANNTFSMG